LQPSQTSRLFSVGMYLFFARDLVRAKQISYQNADQLVGPYREALDLLWAMAEANPPPVIEDLEALCMEAIRQGAVALPSASQLAAAAYLYGWDSKQKSSEK